MSFLNLMQNRLKPKEVNDALLNGGSSSGYDITTDESDTGKKFNGSPVYVRAFSIGYKDYIINQNVTVISKPDYLSKIISFNLYIENSINPVCTPTVFIENDVIKLNPNFATSGSAVCVIEYTKSVSKKTKKSRRV